MEKKDHDYNTSAVGESSSSSSLPMFFSSSPNKLIEKYLLRNLSDSNYENSGIDVNLNLGPPELPVKKCQVCGETTTPRWRNGPHGPMTACNACGIRFRKEKQKLRTDLSLAPPSPKKTSKSHRNN